MKIAINIYTKDLIKRKWKLNENAVGVTAQPISIKKLLESFRDVISVCYARDNKRFTKMPGLIRVELIDDKFHLGMTLESLMIIKKDGSRLEYTHPLLGFDAALNMYEEYGDTIEYNLKGVEGGFITLNT